jgi:hypothetical protein
MKRSAITRIGDTILLYFTEFEWHIIRVSRPGVLGRSKTQGPEMFFDNTVGMAWRSAGAVPGHGVQWIARCTMRVQGGCQPAAVSRLRSSRRMEAQFIAECATSPKAGRR